MGEQAHASEDCPVTILMLIKDRIVYLTQAEYDSLPLERPHGDDGETPDGATWKEVSRLSGEPCIAYYRDPEGHLNRWNYLGTGMTIIYRFEIVESLPAMTTDPSEAF